MHPNLAGFWQEVIYKQAHDEKHACKLQENLLGDNTAQQEPQRRDDKLRNKSQEDVRKLCAEMMT